jgi:hypothetical protein
MKKAQIQISIIPPLVNKNNFLHRRIDYSEPEGHDTGDTQVIIFSSIDDRNACSLTLELDPVELMILYTIIKERMEEPVIIKKLKALGVIQDEE